MKTATTATLQVELRSYWHPGTGRGSGYHLDALSYEGADGLPRLPGRTLKGLLRDALYRAEQWGWPQVPAGRTEALFGTLGRDGRATRPGLLRVSDATLPAAAAAYLGSDEGRHLVPGLYRDHFATAIDGETGVARERSLRGMRVVVPMQLTATITPIPGRDGPPDWRAALAAVFPLVSAVGAYRTRGLGRAVLTWREEQ